MGSEGFVEWIKYNFVENYKSSDEIPEVRKLARKEINLNDILGCVASFYNMRRSEILVGVHGRNNEARKVAVYLMKRLTGADYKDIANKMGTVGKSAVAQLNHRFRKELCNNDDLISMCDALAHNIMSNVKT